MQVLHVNSTDTVGGAGRAAYRLHTGLREGSVDSRMLVRRKASDDPTVTQCGWTVSGKVRERLDQLPLKRYDSKRLFSPNWVPGLLQRRINEIDPDVVHLHWIGKSYLRIEQLAAIDAPIVWTFHDMWPFTGGCHYSMGCARYTDDCGSCPVLGSDEPADLSRRVWKRKRDAWATVDFTPVTPSTWLAERARESSLLGGRPVEVIPNGLDVETFAPTDRVAGRQAFDLPADEPVVLFGAMGATTDPRKGFDEFVAALEKLAERGVTERFHVAVFGASEPIEALDRTADATYLGYVPDERLPTLYATADVMVVPSLQDNLPNTVLEALACGTPVVAFDIGGIPDMVSHEDNGYLATPTDTADLAAGIEWVLDTSDRPHRLGEAARGTVEKRFPLAKTVDDYRSLYRRLV